MSTNWRQCFPLFVDAYVNVYRKYRNSLFNIQYLYRGKKYCDVLVHWCIIAGLIIIIIIMIMIIHYVYCRRLKLSLDPRKPLVDLLLKEPKRACQLSWNHLQVSVTCKTVEYRGEGWHMSSHADETGDMILNHFVFNTQTSFPRSCSWQHTNDRSTFANSSSSYHHNCYAYTSRPYNSYTPTLPSCSSCSSDDFSSAACQGLTLSRAPVIIYCCQ